MEIKIEKGVPIPKSRGFGISEKLRTMKVGESICLGIKYKNTLSHLGHQLLGAGNYTVRRVENGYRLWRIK